MSDDVQSFLQDVIKNWPRTHRWLSPEELREQFTDMLCIISTLATLDAKVSRAYKMVWKNLDQLRLVKQDLCAWRALARPYDSLSQDGLEEPLTTTETSKFGSYQAVYKFYISMIDDVIFEVTDLLLQVPQRPKVEATLYLRAKYIAKRLLPALSQLNDAFVDFTHGDHDSTLVQLYLSSYLLVILVALEPLADTVGNGLAAGSLEPGFADEGDT